MWRSEDTRRVTRKDYIFFCLLSLLAVTVFANGLTGEFIYDDHSYVLENPQVSDGDAIFSKPTPSDRPELGLYRPLVVVSYRLNWLISGFDPAAFHGTNIALHTLVTLAVYLIVRILAKRFLRTAAGSREAAFLSALLFAVHPLHAEAVSWIVGRAELMAALFCLAAFLFHLASHRKWWFLIPAALCYLAACLSKESAFVFPVLLLLIDLFSGVFQRTRPRRALWLGGAAFGLYGAILAVVIALRYSALGAFGPDVALAPYRDETLMERIPVAFSILAESLRVCVLPVGLRIFYHASEMLELTLARLLILATSGGLLVFFLWKKRLFGLFWLLWIPITLLTVVNIVPIGAVFAERFVYLPSVGGCALAGVGLSALCGWRKETEGFKNAVWIPVVVVFVLGFFCWLRNPVYHDPVSLWEDAVSKADFPYTHYNLGESYFERDIIEFMSPDRPGAVFELKRSLALDPNHPYAFAAHFTLGRYYLGEKNDVLTAAYHLGETVNKSQTIDTHPRLAEAFATLAQIALLTRGEAVGVDDALRYIEMVEKAGFRPAEMEKLKDKLDDLKKQLQSSE